MKREVYRNEKGQLHRVDGPAFINDNNHQSWWINDELIINPEDYNHEKIIKDYYIYGI